MTTEAIGPGAGGYEAIPAKEILRLKLEPNEAGDGFVVHQWTKSTGSELVAGVGVLLAQWIQQVSRENGADPRIELGQMIAAIQSQAFHSLAEQLAQEAQP